ncbi:methionine--tRNA ligase [Arenimonas metalli]|uniref:Methionine--tRNA ligase n=1 Tax=Arenimonas metalli CF5-1 TaxID=1384056 RepID=A0A091B9T3_9GAMM|nr:methionine--tRNA ligase [Arenimonas metalli]KFN47599.1 hypothetical protein N787_08550 [Arenimonas metalli CF5-1]
MPAPALVTTALPYANGHLHLGHLVGYVQADIWVRARRMAGGTTHFVCADDAHGTPIMLAAEKAGTSPEDFIRGMQASHEADFAAFGVQFDHYHSTHSDENRELASLIYTRLRDGTHGARAIARRSIQQLFDPERQMFLPDRYIKGACPNCGAADQYGDNCEVCGKAYSPTELKNPRSVVSGAVPELRDSEHYFFELGKFEAFLREWLAGDVAHASVKAKLGEWLEGGLRDWDISRDAPYFGFPIPDAPGKFFYVWLDAPIGYLASFKAFCDRGGADFAAFTEAARNTAGETEMHHFLGKDIINFHGLFWPAMLHGAGLRTPTALHVNGYLTVNGAKMSKSRGTFVQARTYLDSGLEPEALRYYFAAKSSGTVDDIDLNLADFMARVNADLVGKFVNLASRCAGFIEKSFGGRLADKLPDPTQYTHFVESLATVREAYRRNDAASAIRHLMSLADEANKYIDDHKPWVVASRIESRILESAIACHFRSTDWAVQDLTRTDGCDFLATKNGVRLAIEVKNKKAEARDILKLAAIIASGECDEAALIVNGHLKGVEAQHLLSQHPKILLIEKEQLDVMLNDHIQHASIDAGNSVDGFALQAHCTQGLNLFRVIATALAPIIPKTAARAAEFLSAPGSSWSDLDAPLLTHTINTYKPLFTRIDPKQIEAMTDASKEDLKPAGAEAAAAKPVGGNSSPTASPKSVGTEVPPTGSPAKPAASAATTIGIEDFAKLDLRIGKVLECGFVDGSDKLLRFLLDAGELGQRQIFSGIRGSYAEPDKLVGRSVVFIANLAPRKMRFGLSEGMILSAGFDGGALALLDADAGALPGMPVR